MTWISIKDSLPETNQSVNGYIFNSKPVLVWTKKGYFISNYTKRYQPGKNNILDFIGEFWNCTYEVTHWVELPDKPEITEQNGMD